MSDGHATDPDLEAVNQDFAPLTLPSVSGVALLVEPPRAPNAFRRPEVRVNEPVLLVLNGASMNNVLSVPGLSTPCMIAFFSCEGVRPVLCERTRPATPATCGAAIEVPSKTSQPGPGTELVI